MASQDLTRWIDSLLMWPLRHIVERPTTVLKHFVKPGMTALEVGCGEGLHSIAMARLVGSNGRVVSLDLQPETIQTLERRLARSRLSPRIEPRLCTEQDLAIEDLEGQFDFVLAVYVLHHASDPARLMANVHRALKPGSLFLVIEPRHHASAAECRAIESAARRACLTVAGYPKLQRDWAVTFVKSGPPDMMPNISFQRTGPAAAAAPVR
ncbi:MAG: methyltransferase type 11 [Verrucomicrobia bacterium]|nr:MAG: methyltransferase type 11 [Verrucomicrobiota bacterium]